MALVSTVLILRWTSLVYVGVFFLPADDLSLGLVQELFAFGRCDKRVHVRHASLRCLVSDHLEGSLAHFDVEVLLHLFIFDLILLSHKVDFKVFIIVLDFTFVVLIVMLNHIVAILIFRDGV